MTVCFNDVPELFAVQTPQEKNSNKNTKEAINLGNGIRMVQHGGSWHARSHDATSKLPSLGGTVELSRGRRSKTVDKKTRMLTTIGNLTRPLSLQEIAVRWDSCSIPSPYDQFGRITMTNMKQLLETILELPCPISSHHLIEMFLFLSDGSSDLTHSAFITAIASYRYPLAKRGVEFFWYQFEHAGQLPVGRICKQNIIAFFTRCLPIHLASSWHDLSEALFLHLTCDSSAPTVFVSFNHFFAYTSRDDRLIECFTNIVPKGGVGTMSSTQGKKMVLVAWIPLSILLLVWATSYSGSEVSGELSSKSFFHCSDNCNAHGRSTVVNGQCGCICSKGWAGKDCSISDGKEISKAVEEDEGRVKDVGIQHVRSAEEHMGIHDDSDHKVSDHTEHKHEELTEAEKVLRDYPSLQYATEGEEACQKANEVWKERVKTAYGNSQEEIQGKEGLHLYFTTDCTKHSLWQALTLEHSWAKIKQPGALTRIVSGCFKSNGEAHPNTELMKRRTIPHSKFFVFFGPKVGGRQPSRGVVKCDASVAGWYEGAIIKEEKSEGLDDCKHRCRETAGCHYYNFRHGDKACHLFSARGAFHNAEDHSTGACVGGSDTTADAYKLPDYLADYPPINRPATAMYWLNYAKPLERVLGLLDPDMIFARPMLFHYVGNQVVEKGKPVGQFYDYLVSQDWDKHYTAICNEPHVCKPLGNKKDFAPGPPHLMHRKDWFEVAPWWLRYTIGARRLWRAWTSEMAGMSIGLARLGLRSRLVEDGMWDRTTAAANMLKGLDLYFGDMDSWKTCGNENAECDIPDDAEYEVRYGPSPDANFVEKRARGQKLHCSHQTNDLGTGYFTGNDPAPGQAKMCFYRNPAKAIDKKGTNKVFESTEESKWSYCTEEGGTCILPTTSTFSVRFGASSTAEFTEKTGVKGGSHVQCIEQAGAELAFDNDPASGKSKQCFFKQETGKFPPPALQQYISSDKLPSLFHYCFTLEVNRGGWPEKLWRYAAPQRKWEEENGKPLMGYIHWSKYRSLTDWPRRDDAHTILECDQPMLFQFPPLPHMLKNWSKNSEDKGWHVFFAIISPAVNDAMVQYKLQYCPDPSKINYERRVRTGHDQHWISYFETVMDPSAAEGFSFTSHL